MATSVKNYRVYKASTSGIFQVHDPVAVEEPLEIRIGFGPRLSHEQHSLSVTMRTPGHDFELVLGFLFAEGVIQSYLQVENIHYCPDEGRTEDKENIVRVELKPDVEVSIQKLQRQFYTTSSCGVCGKTSIESVQTICRALPKSTIKFPHALIHALPEKLRLHQTVFEHTGGLHAVALVSGNGELILVREDVGRHNAFDKVIGAALIKNQIPLSNTIALVSGRASFELVQKAIMAGIPVLAAVGAPSSLAVASAKEFGMTLLGFVRDERFNIYCGEERITREGQS